MVSSYNLNAIEELAEHSISACFDEAAWRFKDQPALYDRDRMMTFGDLDRCVNRLANLILQRTGNRREPIVLLVDQCALAVAGFLAILKAGKICVPANPVNNEARFLSTMMSEMKPPLVVTRGDHLTSVKALIGEVPVVDMGELDGASGDATVACPPFSEDASIIVYTSGSTSLPKGVLHHHRNILHRVFWYASRFNIGEADRTVMLSAPDHISGLVGILRSLLTGGRLHMWSIRRQGLSELARYIREQGITILPIVNSVYRRLTDELEPQSVLPSLRMIIIGGESAHWDDVVRFRRHFPRGSLLINTLGCTELPTYRFFIIDHETELAAGSIPAGHAVPATDAVVVGDNERRSINGEAGEIVVRSRYLALGYWNRPEETAKKFSFNADGTRSFRTGDLGRIRGDGILEFLGRRDWFVKILGNRVELEEIEAMLRAHPDLRDACVVLQRETMTDAKLCAYVVARAGRTPSRSDLQAFLRLRLPDYMVPSFFEFLPDLPLNRNGKTDRRALESRKAIPRANRVNDTRPGTDAERLIAGICEEVLGDQQIGINENLFDLGANSLLAMMIVSRLSRAFDVELPITLVFDLPTVAELAMFLSGSVQQRSENGTGQ
jgi:amino acid adenylation domain-containing protein